MNHANAAPGRVEDRFPTLFSSGYSRLPNELADHGHRLALTPNERALIAAVHRHQAGGGIAYPDTEQLIRETGLGSKRTVYRTVSGLEARGLLAVHRVRGSGGRQLANQYDLTPLWRALAVVAGESAPGDNSDAAGCQTVHPDRVTNEALQEDPGRKTHNKEDDSIASARAHKPSGDVADRPTDSPVSNEHPTASTDAIVRPPAERAPTGRREAIRGVPCPRCAAQVGDPCRGEAFGRNHRERFQAHDRTHEAPRRAASSSELRQMAAALDGQRDATHAAASSSELRAMAAELRTRGR